MFRGSQCEEPRLTRPPAHNAWDEPRRGSVEGEGRAAALQGARMLGRRYTNGRAPDAVLALLLPFPCKMSGAASSSCVTCGGRTQRPPPLSDTQEAATLPDLRGMMRAASDHRRVRGRADGRRARHPPHPKKKK
ncbi:hypothetical protein HPB50_027204 [Hyalomma asiaticum]|uniref:Uncharacterized protein n=1 Tax=Hyalomma asiaticum TaxID=266040 RepID=A0ACB7TRY2_HYAAI|nr:hypothetical protein HPB50_027204 [Hyalomma asiaticum]